MQLSSKVSVITKCNYQQTEGKNLECKKQAEMNIREQNCIENISVTACPLFNSRQHFRENRFFFFLKWGER